MPVARNVEVLTPSSPLTGSTSTAKRPRISKSDLTVSKPTLRVIQLICALISLLSLSILVVSIPLTQKYYDQLCNGLAGPCVAQLTPKALQTLKSIGFSQQDYVNFLLGDLIFQYIISVGFAGLLFWRKPDHVFSLMWATSSLMMASFPFTSVFVVIGPVEWRLPALIFASLSFWLTWTAVYLFPNMHFAPSWAWLILGFYIVVQLIFNVATAGKSSVGPGDYPLTQLAFILLLGGGFISQIYRFFRVSDQLQRQQTKWVLYGLGLLFLSGLSISLLLPALLPALGQPGSLAYLFTLPVFTLTPYFVSLGFIFGILRYRLWDIDLIINRTLVFVLLTGCMIGLYGLIVLGVTNLLGLETTNLAVSLLATGLIAVLFQPLRLWLQRGVNRLLFGRRDEPYSVLAGLGKQLETVYQPEAVLPELVKNIASTLKLPYVAIKLGGEKRVVNQTPSNGTNGSELATTITPTPPLTSLNLCYQGEPVGELLVSPRRGEERLARRDMQLLQDLAHPIGVVVYSLKLLEELRQTNIELTSANQDLQQARERIITASEEERRRLSRDLHDGVGPTLASVAQRLEIAAGLVEKEPREAVQRIGEIKNQVKTTLGEIRRIVYGLRPPALDEYGLVPTIVEHAAGLYPLKVQVEAPPQLPPLPAAVEVTAYRIILEALTNVERHAQATHCLVRLGTSTKPNFLTLEISDDGRGLPHSYRAGVGLTSMKERTAELGGEYRLESGSGLDGQSSTGTRIMVKLPLPGPLHASL